MLNGSERDSTAVHTSFFVAYTSRPRLAEEVVPTLAILANLIAVVEPLTQLERVISRPGQQMVLHRSVSADVHGTRASGEVPVCASPWVQRPRCIAGHAKRAPTLPTCVLAFRW